MLASRSLPFVSLRFKARNPESKASCIATAGCIRAVAGHFAACPVKILAIANLTDKVAKDMGGSVMSATVKALLPKLLFWLAIEIFLNLVGLDNLADYSEFIISQSSGSRHRISLIGSTRFSVF